MPKRCPFSLLACLSEQDYEAVRHLKEAGLIGLPEDAAQEAKDIEWEGVRRIVAEHTLIKLLDNRRSD